MSNDTITPHVDRAVLLQLAPIQARRYLRHPLFIVGVLLLLLGLAQSYLQPGQAGSQWYELGLATGMFLGVPGIVIGYRLAVTEEKAVALLPSVPVDRTLRTLALCLACLVPALTVVTFFVLYAVVNQLSPSGSGPPYSLHPSDGTIGWIEFLAYQTEVVVAGVGGPLLGVLAARWLHFPGAGVLVAVGLFVVELIALSLGEGGPSFWDAWWNQAFVDLMPWVYWGADPDGDRLYDAMRPGSPVGHLLYAASLCGLAVTAAVVRDLSGAARRTWLRRGWILLALAAGGYLWAVAG